MTLQNLHTHTVFGDGKNTPEEMVLGALSSRCASLGFSEHSPLPPAADPDGWTMKETEVGAYRAEILRLREKYRGKIDIFLGLEQDFDSPPPAEKYDYFIGSVHSVAAGGRLLSVDNTRESFVQAVREHFGGDFFAFARAYYRRMAAAAQARRNSPRFAATTVAPTGVDQAKDTVSPAQKHPADVTAAQRVTPRKLRKSRMAVKAGKITREEISMAPIIRIPSTMVSAVRMARRALYRSAFRPVAREKLSSKVTAKIRW